MAFIGREGGDRQALYCLPMELHLVVQLPPKFSLFRGSSFFGWKGGIEWAWHNLPAELPLAWQSFLGDGRWAHSLEWAVDVRCSENRGHHQY